MDLKGLPRWLSGKEPTCQSRRHRRHRFNPWIQKILWRRHGNPLQYFCLENQTRLMWLSMPTRKSPRSFEMMDSRDSPWLFWFEKSVDRSLHIRELLIVSLKRWFWWRGLGTSRQHLISEICVISCVWQQQHYIYNSYLGHFQMTSTILLPNCSS